MPWRVQVPPPTPSLSCRNASIPLKATCSLCLWGSPGVTCRHGALQTSTLHGQTGRAPLRAAVPGLSTARRVSWARGSPVLYLGAKRLLLWGRRPLATARPPVRAPPDGMAAHGLKESAMTWTVMGREQGGAPSSWAGGGFGFQGGDPRRMVDGVRIDLSTCVNFYGPPARALAVLSGLNGDDLQIHPYAASAQLEERYAACLGVDPRTLVAGRVPPSLSGRSVAKCPTMPCRAAAGLHRLLEVLSWQRLRSICRRAGPLGRAGRGRGAPPGGYPCR